GRNIFMDLTEYAQQPRRHVEDLAAESGLVKLGGSCILDRPSFQAQSRARSQPWLSLAVGQCLTGCGPPYRGAQEKGELQSWWHELRGFNGRTTKRSQKRACDVWVEEPTFIMKLDAGINMYHHFCDFMNLWLTQHIAGLFDRNTNLFFWDASTGHY